MNEDGSADAAWYADDPEVAIDAALVRRLVAKQYPQWAQLPVTPVEPGGWDNRTFRLGDELKVRLPSAARYMSQVEKEHRWLPQLAPKLPLPIPHPVAIGAPDDQFPYPWSILRWLDGESALTAQIVNLTDFAVALAEFIGALQRIDPSGGPPPGRHSFYRGAPLQVYDEETREAIRSLQGHIPSRAAEDVWNAALKASWRGTPVWFHGDVAAGNLLVREGRLAAVIDFGQCGVGDPACDMAIAWTLLSGQSREAFRSTVRADSATWQRGRGWALWKALITLAAHRDGDDEARDARRVIQWVLTDSSQEMPARQPS